MTEVLQGFQSDYQFQRALSLFESLAVVRLGGKQIALQAAGNYRTLRKLGITVRKTIDTIIATCCIHNGYQLLYRDRDFDPFVHLLGLQAVVP